MDRIDLTVKRLQYGGEVVARRCSSVVARFVLRVSSMRTGEASIDSKQS